MMLRADHFGLPPRITSSAVNNAGSAHGLDHVGDILDSDIDAMFATNVLGLMSVTQLLIKGPFYSSGTGGMSTHLTLIHSTDFKARNTGHVINIGSIAGRESYVGGSIYCASKAAVRAFTGSLLREVVNTPIRVTEIQPGSYYSHLYLSVIPNVLFVPPIIGMVETEFSLVRFRGDKSAADNVYDGLLPCASCFPTSSCTALIVCLRDLVTAEDIAEEIVWAAARPPHVNIAEVYVLPVNQASPTLSYRGGTK